MSVPFLTVRPKAIKLKVIPKIPADLHEGTGIEIEKAESVFTVSIDYSNIQPAHPIPPPLDNNQQVLLWDEAHNTYSLLPAHYLGGDIWVDAPSDGFTYGRLYGAWDQVLSLINGGAVTGNVMLNGVNTVGGATTFNAAASFTSTLTSSGTATFTGTIAVPTPTLAGQAANKSYVDSAVASGVSGAAGNALPLMNGVAAAGVSALYSRQDHVHPTDTTRAPLASPALTGTPTAPTPAPGDNSTKIATTAFVTLSFAPLASPALSGTPTAPTAPVNTNTTQIATTAFVVGQAATVAPLMDGAAAVGGSLLYARQDHVHPTDTTRAPTVNPTFTGVTTIRGQFSLSGIVSPPSLSANQNNYYPTGLDANTILRLTASGAVNITGLQAQPTGTVVALTNIGSNSITLTNLDAGSLAANQFNLGANTALGPGQTALLFYDGIASQWRNLAGSGSGGGGAAVYIQDVAPSGVAAGSLWWQSSTGILFIYYNDGNSSQWVSINAVTAPGSASPVIQGLLQGLTLSTAGSSATFSVAAGVACDSTAVGMMKLAAAISKTTAAWAVGNAGALDTGAIAASTWYHAFIISGLTAGVVPDVLISLSPTAPTLPPGYTIFRRIGSMKTDGSSNWIAFVQNGDEFLWVTAARDVVAAAQSTTTLARTLSVPTGIKVNALFTGSNYGVVNQLTWFYSPDHANISGFSTMPFTIYDDGTGGGAAAPHNVRTNTAAQIWTVCALATGTNNVAIVTFGWIDRRGRDN